MSDTETPAPRADCPWCKEGDSLFIAAMTTFVAKPVGTWSLSGAQTKTTGTFQTVPVLVCSACRSESVGWSGDDDHIEFDAENNRHPLTEEDFAKRKKYLIKIV
jgi:hypothetical protein